MLFGRAPLTLLTFLAVGTSLSDAQDCAAETAAILSSPNVTEAYAQLDEGIIDSVTTCVESGNENCDVNVDTSGVQDACESEGGVFFTEDLDISCTNSDTGLATLIDYEYLVCVGANCTEGETDYEDQVNAALENITAAINVVVAPIGVECSALLVSGATKMSVAFMMTSLVMLVSYGFF